MLADEEGLRKWGLELLRSLVEPVVVVVVVVVLSMMKMRQGGSDDLRLHRILLDFSA